MNQKVVIIGASGHAKVVADIIIANNDQIVGFLDDNIAIGTKILDYEVIGTTLDVSRQGEAVQYCMAIGDNDIRKKIVEVNKTLSYYTAIHPSAIISPFAKIGVGSVIMPNSVIQSGSEIGKFCIVNTMCVVEHDDQIGDYVHLSPSVALSGTVTIAELSHLGTGVKVKNNIHINTRCIIGVGAVVTKDIEEPGVYIGVPAVKVKGWGNET